MQRRLIYIISINVTDAIIYIISNVTSICFIAAVGKCTKTLKLDMYRINIHLLSPHSKIVVAVDFDSEHGA